MNLSKKITAKPRFYIEEELSTEWADHGPWRSYSVLACGNTLEEVLADAFVFETDQDGGELNNYSIDEGSEACREAEALIRERCAGVI